MLSQFAVLPLFLALIVPVLGFWLLFRAVRALESIAESLKRQQP